MIQTQYGVRLITTTTIEIYQQDTDLNTGLPSGNETILATLSDMPLVHAKQTGGVLQMPGVISGLILEAGTDMALAMSSSQALLDSLVDQLNEKPRLTLVEDS